MPNPAELGARPGDVAHVRSDGLYGWAIRRVLRGAWGNHDGIVVYANGQWGVAEALFREGFVVTPWIEYEAAVLAQSKGVAFLRPRHMPEHMSHVVMMGAMELADAHVKYDWRAILEIWALTAVGAAYHIEREWEWYCSEIVMALHHNAGEEWDVWKKRMPTPLTTEKRHRAGMLVRVGGFGDEEYVKSFPQQLPTSIVEPWNTSEEDEAWRDL